MSFISDASYSVPDTGNTTTSALGAGATFTGVAIEDNHPDVFIDIRTDVECTVYKDFSVDGVNFTSFPVNGYELSSLNNYTIVDSSVKAGRYYRIRIVNGAVAQTFLRAYTYLGLFKQLNSPLNQAYSQQSGSTLVRPTWTWLDIARGLSPGITSIKKFGRNPSVGTTFEPVTFGGIYQTPQGSAATTLRIKSGGNANDDAAGTGARSVMLYGLDENFNEVEESIATAGASASAVTTATFTRLFRVLIDESGTYASSTAGSHAGNIVIENGSGGTDWAEIDSTNFSQSQSEIGAYTVPSGYSGFAKLRNLSIDSGKTIDLVFFSRANADQESAPYDPMRAQSVVSGVSGGSIEVFGDTDIPFGPYVGPTDVGFMAKVSAGNASVSVEFEIILIND